MGTLISSLMGTVFRTPDDKAARTFSADFKQLFNLSDKEIQDFLAILPVIRLTRLRSKDKEILESFFKIHPNLTRPQIESSYSALNFFLTQLMNTDLPNDDYTKWGTDLETLNLLEKKNHERFERLISSLRKIIEDSISKEVARRKSAQSVGPLFWGCSIAASIRGVLKNEYTSGAPAEGYQPEVVDSTAVATFNITLKEDSGEKKDVYFNAEESDIDYLINGLQAAKKELAALRDYIGKK